jgi:hypothetical protein
MLRRDFVRAVVSVSLAPRLLLAQQTANPAPPPPAPVPWTLGLNAKTPLPHTEEPDGITEMERRFFTPVQMASLMRLSDLLLPPIGNKPGALQAETPLFRDFLIGSSPAPRKKVYTGGLDWLDSESKSKYKMPFAKLDDVKAGAMLKPWLRTWMSDHPPTEAHADFVNIAHEDIRTATMNSKVWSDTGSSGARASSTGGELFWSPIEPDVYAANHGHLSAVVLAAPRAAHTMPSYSR